MQRAWDIAIGTLIVAASLVCQAAVIFIVIGLLCGAIASHFNLKGNWWIWGVELTVAIALNVLTFYEFRRRVTRHRMLGLGGGFFLLPRGLYRIAFGRETYLDQPDSRSGFPVLPPVEGEQATNRKSN